jgi:death-on-curing protein
MASGELPVGARAVIFLTKGELLVIHARTLAEHGGAPGILSEAGLESALVAAENRAWYEQADLPVCAATYAFHLCQAHAFVDGNKRVAAVAAEVFVIANGGRLETDDDAYYELVMGLASGAVTRAEAEEWFRARVAVSGP